MAERVHGYRNEVIEATLRVPLIIWDPRHPRAGSRTGVDARLEDLPATILGRAGLSAEDLGVPGRDLLGSEASSAREPGYAYLCSPEAEDSYYQGFSIRSKGRLVVTQRFQGKRADFARDLSIPNGARVAVGEMDDGPALLRTREAWVAARITGADGASIELDEATTRDLKSLGYLQ